MKMALDNTSKESNSKERLSDKLMERHDSSYSSCSEESSHSSMSRESSCSTTKSVIQSSTIDSESTHKNQSEMDEFLRRNTDFATRLGFSVEQLKIVLEKLGTNAGQDEILTELIKFGRGFSRSRITASNQTNVILPVQFRSIVIDGSNIAMTHGRKEVFSCRGILECVQFFRNRGHTDIIVFVPQFRREVPRSDCPITDQHILFELERENVLVWTPSRRINGRRIVCHDDRYILKTADEKDAVIVSNDEYRDLIKENPRYRILVNERLLMYSFVDGRFMPPDDPLGRYGPKLAQFLTKGNTPLHAQLCPYARKCTYGNKCKFYHPERPNGIHVSVTERLMREKQRKELLPVYDSQMKSTASESSIYPTIMRTQNLNLPMLDAAKKTSDNRKLMQNIVINSPRERSRQMPLHPHLALSVHQNTPLSRNWPLLSQNHHPSLVVSNSAPSPSLRLHSNPYHSSNSFPQPLCLPFTYNGLRYHNGNEPHQEIGSNALLSPHCFVPNSPAGSNNMCGKNNTISSQPQIPFIPAWNKSKLNSAKSLRTNQNNPSVINDRNQLQNILCQLFPKRIVLTVMDAFPDENDPRELCPRIIAQLRGSINNE